MSRASVEGVPLALILAGKSHPPVVYFVRVADGIKIGSTSNLMARMRALHAPLRNVLAVVPGGRKAEDAYHEQFAAYRVYGEVFDIEDQLAHLTAAPAPRVVVAGRPPGRPCSLDPDRRSEVRKLRDQGHNVAMIARAIGTSRGTVYRVLSARSS